MGTADPLQRFRLPQRPGGASECIALCAIAGLGNQQQNDDVNRLAVDGVEVDGMAEAGEKRKRRLKTRQPRMRQRHAIADAGRAKLLALGDLAYDLLGGKTGLSRGLHRQLLKQAALVARLHIDHDLSWREKIADLHCCSSKHSWVGRGWDVSVRRLKPIADAGFRQNVLRPCRVGLYLVPELPDIDAEILRVNACGPKFLEKELMGQNLACVLNQQTQQLILLRRKLHLLAAALDDATHKIDRQVAELEDWALALHLELMPERRADAGEQFLHAKGLGHVVVGALVQGRDLGHLIAAA